MLSHGIGILRLLVDLPWVPIVPRVVGIVSPLVLLRRRRSSWSWLLSHARCPMLLLATVSVTIILRVTILAVSLISISLVMIPLILVAVISCIVSLIVASSTLDRRRLVLLRIVVPRRGLVSGVLIVSHCCVGMLEQDQSSMSSPRFCKRSNV